MKNIGLIILGFLFTFQTFGQISLTESEIGTLTEICNQYHVRLIESTLFDLKDSSPERFKGFINQLIISKDKPKKILDNEILKRPTHEELIFWYVIREFHSNTIEPDSLQKTQREIIDWILKDTIDERWLLDNYYYRILVGLGVLYNKANLSKYNFDIDKLGFKNETEKAIFFFHVVNFCGHRLSVMRMTGKGDPQSVIKRMPKINGDFYYKYQDFNYVDFDWIRYKKIESYNERHLGNYYSVLINHMDILFENKLAKEAHMIFDNSILSRPEYFKFSGNRDRLDKNYKMMKQ